MSSSEEVSCPGKEVLSWKENEMGKEGKEVRRRGNRGMGKAGKKTKGLEENSSRGPSKRGRKTVKENMQNLINAYVVGTPPEVN